MRFAYPTVLTENDVSISEPLEIAYAINQIFNQSGLSEGNVSTTRQIVVLFSRNMY